MRYARNLSECRDPSDYMHLACAVWSVGYSQPNRRNVYDGGETDCSALVSWCVRRALGLNASQLPWFSTYSELTALAAHGYRQLRPAQVQPTRNDVLWHEGHTAIYIGGGNIGQASRTENHDAGWDGSKPGDQDGGETNIAPYDATRWTLILRNEDMAALGARIENGDIGGDDMGLIICPSGTTTQYYFDGQALHGIAKPSEREAIINAYKATGRELTTVHWKRDQFDALVRMLQRGA